MLFFALLPRCKSFRFDRHNFVVFLLKYWSSLKSTTFASFLCFIFFLSSFSSRSQRLYLNNNVDIHKSTMAKSKWSYLRFQNAQPRGSPRKNWARAHLAFMENTLASCGHCFGFRRFLLLKDTFFSLLVISRASSPNIVSREIGFRHLFPLPFFRCAFPNPTRPSMKSFIHSETEQHVNLVHCIQMSHGSLKPLQHECDMKGISFFCWINKSIAAMYGLIKKSTAKSRRQ